ncbi:MAG: hypothetical protein FWH41_04715 [Treponema sp.]|nr:hypothetical protein [Treponema sp.]
MSDQYRQELERWKLQNDYNWKLFDGSKERIGMLNRRQYETDMAASKWLMSIAAGSFGLSFAFIEKFVAVAEAVHVPLLIAAWSCFIAVIVLEITSMAASSFLHTALAEEEAKMLLLKYEGKQTEYKRRSIFFNIIAALGYASLLLFAGGSICLLTFIGKNLAV